MKYFILGKERFDKTPSTWYPVTCAGKRTASVVCPQGHVGVLDEHEIAADGTVTPSIVCTQDGCTFHEHMKLKDWPHQEWR